MPLQAARWLLGPRNAALVLQAAWLEAANAPEFIQPTPSGCSISKPTSEGRDMLGLWNIGPPRLTDGACRHSGISQVVTTNNKTHKSKDKKRPLLVKYSA